MHSPIAFAAFEPPAGARVACPPKCNDAVGARGDFPSPSPAFLNASLPGALGHISARDCGRGAT